MIANPQGIWYGVYYNAGTWTQASMAFLPTHIAVLDSEPTVAGTYSGTIYSAGETINPANVSTDIETEFFAYLDGIASGELSTVSDATAEETISLLASTLIKNNHGKGVDRKMPTGLAWHGDTIHAVEKGATTEFRAVEIDLSERASIDNMLFGYNLSSWQTVLSLPADGTIEEQEQAVKRKLSDIGGLQADDVTRELHNAGFTQLYAYANKFDVTLPALQAGLTTQVGLMTESTTLRHFVSIDPRSYKTDIPITQAGFETLAGLTTQAGLYRYQYPQAGLDTQAGFDTYATNVNNGADLVVNSSEDEFDKWDTIPANPENWVGCIFISGSTFSDIAEVGIDRRRELRKLLCEIKPFKSYAIITAKYV